MGHLMTNTDLAVLAQHNVAQSHVQRYLQEAGEGTVWRWIERRQ